MDFKTLFRAVAIKTGRHVKSHRLLYKSYVSLFLVMIVGIVSVSAWFTSSHETTLKTSTMAMTGATGMRNSENQKIINEVKIPTFELDEASSVDGKNIFFPTTVFDHDPGYTNSNIKTITENLTYRAANAGDCNKRYAYAEIALNGSAPETNVWIRSYKVKIGDEVFEDALHVSNAGSSSSDPSVLDYQAPVDDCPVRIAIISDSGTGTDVDTPKIIDPSALVKDYSINTDSVYYVNQEGSPTLQRTELDSFSSFYYGTNNPLFVLDQGETKNVAFIAWLEGTHSKADDYKGKMMSVDIEIETNITDMSFIYFHDWTANDDAGSFGYSEYVNKSTHWLSNDNAIIALSYTDPEITDPVTHEHIVKTTVMTKMRNGESFDGIYTASDDYTYAAAIPNYVYSDISFYRLNAMADYLNEPNNVVKGNVYNSWHTKTGINSQLSSTAKGWVKSFGLGGLAESRIVSNKTCFHYYGIRGNGYGEISHTDGNKFLYWLSPCVGYWKDNSGNFVYNNAIPTNNW